MTPGGKAELEELVTVAHLFARNLNDAANAVGEGRVGYALQFCAHFVRAISTTAEQLLESESAEEPNS